MRTLQLLLACTLLATLIFVSGAHASTPKRPQPASVFEAYYSLIIKTANGQYVGTGSSQIDITANKALEKYALSGPGGSFSEWFLWRFDL